MKLVAAYLLAVLGGNANPSAEEIRNILGSVGIEADDEKLEFLLSQVKGKDINELLAAGREKLASAAAHGGAVLGVAAAAPSASMSDAAAPPSAESKKNEEKVEEKEGSDDDMMFRLFD